MDCNKCCYSCEVSGSDPLIGLKQHLPHSKCYRLVPLAFYMWEGECDQQSHGQCDDCPHTARPLQSIHGEKEARWISLLGATLEPTLCLGGRLLRVSRA